MRWRSSGRGRKLDGAVVVVTGAASGIGRATALAFAREGARLHLADIDAAGLEAAVAEIREKGSSAQGHVVDCSHAEQVSDLAHSVYSAEGRTDVLHNNAGVCLGGPVERIRLEDWRWITDVNLWGVIHGIHAFVPRMIEQGGGAHIVNTASMAGLVGLPYVAPYCATKFAIVGLSESLDAELAVHGIAVTAVCPGAVATNVFRSGRIVLPDPWGERIARAVDRWGTDPDAIARAIVKAVRSGRGMSTPGREMMPLWLVQRLSPGLYRFLARTLTSALITGSRARPAGAGRA